MEQLEHVDCAEVWYGSFSRVVESADDKGRALDDILLDEMAREGRDPDSLSVYVGDAPMDLLPLLAVSI